MKEIFADYRVNSGARRSQFILTFFRFASSMQLRHVLAGRLVSIAYRIATEWLQGVEIPPGTSIGPGLRLHHPIAIVINRNAVIGANVSVHQSVTIGGKRGEFDCPRIEDGVRIGANAVIIGQISIGAGAVIGAGSVVVADVPAGATVVGNPARLLKVK